MPESDRPTDPMTQRVGMALGAEAEMHECAREARKVTDRRSGIRDPETRNLSRDVAALYHRQAGLYHLVSVALLPLREPEKQKAPIGLWGHIKLWWRERRG